VGLVAVFMAPSPNGSRAIAFLVGASIGAIEVVMNIRALLVERGSGENLMLGFHGHFSVGGFARALLLSLEFCPKAHFGLFLLQCSLLCAKRAYYSFKLISVRAFTRLAIGPIARLTKPPNDQDRS
jgi:hypothetical protein